MNKLKLIETILSYAAKLPTGLVDFLSLEKYQRERQELSERLEAGDTIGAYLEAGDCAYYAIKAYYNDFIDPGEVIQMIDEAARAVGLTPNQVLMVCEVKYKLRAQSGNPKDDAAERAEVEKLFKGEDCSSSGRKWNPE